MKKHVLWFATAAGCFAAAFFLIASLARSASAADKPAKPDIFDTTNSPPLRPSAFDPRPSPGPFQCFAAGSTAYVFEPATGRMWAQHGAFLKPVMYQTAAGILTQFTPPPVSKELEEFGKLKP